MAQLGGMEERGGMQQDTAVVRMVKTVEEEVTESPVPLAGLEGGVVM
jgi:hypothetical protein